MQFTDIVIESSPFLRAMMTAAWLARELGVKTVYVKFTLVEYLTKCRNIDLITFSYK